MTSYCVMELQNGQLGEHFWSYETLPQAEAKYYTTLSYACVSEVECHTVVLMQDDGMLLDVKSYDRRPKEEE